MEENCDKEIHTDELDTIYSSCENKITEERLKDSELVHNLKLYFRFLRRRFSLIFPEKKDKSLKEIIYLTLSEPPIDFISAFRLQYPDKIIKVLMPIDNIEGLEDLEVDVLPRKTVIPVVYSNKTTEFLKDIQFEGKTIDIKGDCQFNLTLDDLQYKKDVTKEIKEAQEQFKVLDELLK